MPCFKPRGIFSILRHLLTNRCLIIITSLIFTASILWMQNRTDDEPLYNESVAQEALDNVAQDSRYVEVYRKKARLRNLKYILLWTPDNMSPFYYFGKGQKQFLKNNCSMTNCYVSANRNLFGGDLSKFDAIAFNGRSIRYTRQYDLPKTRYPYQKYIFVNMESADNYPVCNKIFDEFFNWTATYRLDSDILMSYLIIRNAEGDVVGPKRVMKWNQNMRDLDKNLAYKLQNKTKAAAWFVSHCGSRSGRKEFVAKLQKALDRYGLEVDIYGKCGPLKCPKERQEDCARKLERDYFFYMSLENSFAKDYVTEKLLTALEHYVVPIVYGAANYSSFLPPSSYVDGRTKSPEDLAHLMHQLMNSPGLYRQYLRWKPYYTYRDPTAVENICAMCAALNNKTMVETRRVYTKFRSWWNHDYRTRCRSWQRELL